MPSGRSPVCRRRYVGKECEVTGEIPECAAFAEPQKTVKDTARALRHG